MFQSPSMIEKRMYRLAILLPDRARLLARRHGTEVTLPCVSISHQKRPAAEIQRVVRMRWALSIVILDFLNRPAGVPGCAVAQLLYGSSADESWVSVGLDDLSFPELTAVESATIEAISRGDAGCRGVFSRTGWVDEAIEWIRREVGPSVRLTGDLEQYNARGTFALVRFDTEEAPAYWLKATGEPNRDELGITAALVALCPECLPPLISTRSDWNAWLMEEAGEPITQEGIRALLKNAALSTATLQKATIGHSARLLAAGAADQRTMVLRRHAGEIFTYIEDAMGHQLSTKVPRIPPSHLRKMRIVFEDACAAMEDLSIPDTVIHNDLNLGNILVRDDTCVLTDWSEACIGNPFLTLQRLLMLLTRSDGDTLADELRLRRAYEHYWLDTVPSWKIDIASTLLPLLAPFSYLYGRGDWLRSADGNDPVMEAHARRVARYMDHAAQSASLLEALCN